MTSTPNTTASTEKKSRREMLRAGTIGAASLAASSVMTARQSMAQSERTDRGLEGKTAFVTGGARGIGLASAEEFAKAGANIVLFDIASTSMPHVKYALSSQADLAAAQAQIEALGVQCITYKGDVRNLEDQQAAKRSHLAARSASATTKSKISQKLSCGLQAMRPNA